MRVALLLLAVCLTAFAAHTIVDVVGDFALAHDTYDDVGHSSRIGTLAGAAVLVLLVVVEALGAALSRSAGHGAASSVARSVLRSPWRFGCTVAVLSVAAVAGMEYVDGVLAGAPVDGLAEALGGSIALGLGVTLACAGLVSTLVVQFARALSLPCAFVARLLRAIAHLPRRAAAPAGNERAHRTPRPRPQTFDYAFCAAKRGPPLRLA
jgi:hypothetical protein